MKKRSLYAYLETKLDCLEIFLFDAILFIPVNRRNTIFIICTLTAAVLIYLLLNGILNADVMGTELGKKLMVTVDKAAGTYKESIIRR